MHRSSRAVALHVHAQLRGSIDAFLTEIEAINKVRPVKGLRWSFAHADQLEPKDLDRLRRLGMAVQVHSRPTIQGQLMMKIHRDRTLHMPPMPMLPQSGMPRGLRADATAGTPADAFY